MGKRLSLAGAIGVLFVALTAAPAAAATATLDNCLQGDAVICVGDDASINYLSGAKTALQGTNFKVAVVHYEESAPLKGVPLAEKLATDNGLSDLILVEDLDDKDRLSVYSKNYDGLEIGIALREKGMADGSEAIAATTNIGSFYDQPVASSSADGAGVGPFAIILPGVIALAAVGAGVGFLIRKRMRPESVAAEKKAESLSKVAKTVQLSDDLRDQLNRLSATAERYRRSSSTELIEASSLISTALGNVYELFRRIDKKNSKQYRELAQIRYLDIAQKLNSALSEDYFEYIVKSPSFWEKADEKKAAVLSALRSVDRQIVENIKQVNSSKEIEFKVAVDSLIGQEGPTIEDTFGSDDAAKKVNWQ